MRFPIKYYDNWAALPMVISLVAGAFCFGLGLKENNAVCAIIGLILLCLFVVLKIVNAVLSNK